MKVSSSFPWRRRIAQLLGVVAVLALAIQFLPIGRDHTNPQVSRDAPWADVADRRLAVAACYDCHSNETSWRWYNSIAPVSWWTASHVEEGREELNFSEWDRRQDVDELAESVEEGSMPMSSYTFVHPAARLSAAERAQLVEALQALPPPGR